jgi:tRNA (guanine37-N1)-methyltransferase
LIFRILTLFPEAFDGYLKSSLLGKATADRRVPVELTNFRDFATDAHRTCDDAPYGGGAGMLLKPEPLFAALESIDARRKRVVLPSPSGKRFDQAYARRLSALDELVIVCGHYEGVDQRVIDRYVSDEVCIGDYVLFSGEVAAMVMIDAVARLAGIVKESSLKEESFENGLLEYPQYTRPWRIGDMEVPDVLRSGNHAMIREWRLRRSLDKTRANRPDLLSSKELPHEVRSLLEDRPKE